MKTTLASLFLAMMSLASVSGSPVLKEATEVQRRAVPAPSGGSLCYFSCPSEVNGLTFTRKVAMGDYVGVRDVNVCLYGPNISVLCWYGGDGALVPATVARSDANCPITAPTAGCSSQNPDPQRNFKRHLPAHEMTKAERIIQARQYRGPKARQAV